MNRHVQFPGVRKWAGDHLAELQSEPLQVLDRFFGQFGPYVLQGCEVTPAADGDNLYDVAPGLVALAGKDRSDNDAVMIVPFAGATGFPLPIYLTLAWEVRRREYVSGGVKPIAYDYYAEGSTVQPEAGTPHLLLNDKTPRFVDVIQDTKHSFITEAERSKWNELLTIKPWVIEQLAAFDPIKVGELRRFQINQEFNDPKYLPCDGSEINPGDYPDLQLPLKITNGPSLPTPANAVGSLSNYHWFGALKIIVAVYQNTSTSFDVYTSVNDGQTWKTIAGVSTKAITTIEESNGNLILASQDANGYTTIIISSDGGNSWAKIYNDTVTSNISMFVKGSDGVIAGFGNRVYRSTNSGASWSKTESPVTETIHDAIYNNGRFIISILASSNPIFFSDDDCTTFTQSDSTHNFYRADRYSMVAIDDSTIIFTSGISDINSSPGKTARSLDNGTTVTTAGTRSDLESSGKPAAANGIAISVGSHGIYRTESKGSSWTKIKSFVGPYTAATEHCSYAFGIFFACAFGELYYSRDGGVSFEKASSDLSRSYQCIYREDGQRLIISSRGSNHDQRRYMNPYGQLPNLSDIDSKSYIKVLK